MDTANIDILHCIQTPYLALIKVLVIMLPRVAHLGR